MRKKIAAALLIVSGAASAQYMIVGKDSISLQDFKKQNLYGLQNSGVEKTLKNTQDFMLLQQFAAEKKADTLSFFRNRMGEREAQLREENFYPQSISNGLLQDYVKKNQTELNVHFFTVAKTAEDKTDYQKVYSDVVSGRMSMDDAIKTYVKQDIKPMYIKPGLIDEEMYAELLAAKPGSYTKLYNNSSSATFAKLVNTRPSLGYLVFGTLSYPNDGNAVKMKTDIDAALTSGKKFIEVTKEFGSTENEKNNGGAVLGSPTLPDEVYAALKGKTVGYTSEPILMQDKYFIFHIYDLVPYQLNEKSTNLFKREMMQSNYSDLLVRRMISNLKNTPNYKEGNDLKTIRTSYAAFKNFKNDHALLYQYNNHKITYGDLRKALSDKTADLENIANDRWQEFVDFSGGQFLMASYSQDFTGKPEIKKELDEFRRNTFSEYIFSEYLRKEVDANPQWLTDYYNKNKVKYMWDERAQGRVAILSDDTQKSEITKAIKNIKDWEALKKKYYGVLNDKKQILVHFEEGKMEKSSEIFEVNKVPFKKGVHTSKLKGRTVVIAIDEVLPPQQMSQEESKELLYDAVTEQKLQETIASQRAKTKIVVEPAFQKDLEANFKK